jgi:hypothetical protein
MPTIKENKGNEPNIIFGWGIRILTVILSEYEEEVLACLYVRVFLGEEEALDLKQYVKNHNEEIEWLHQSDT